MAAPTAPRPGAGAGAASDGFLHLLPGNGECWGDRCTVGGGQTVHWGGLLATLGSVQVVLDCPADSCFEYIYQHEPYLRDPVAYPKVQVSAGSGDPCATQDTTTALSLCSQMLIYLFYVLPFLCLCIYALLRPGCSWLPDWSLVFAGAVAQVRAGSRGGVGGQVGTHPASGAAPRAASAA